MMQDGKKTQTYQECVYIDGSFADEYCGSIDTRNRFRIEMLIRHASDGKRYLYDFVNVKKETSNPL